MSHTTKDELVKALAEVGISTPDDIEDVVRHGLALLGQKDLTCCVCGHTIYPEGDLCYWVPRKGFHHATCDKEG
jgi:hypothetical protein